MAFAVQTYCWSPPPPRSVFDQSRFLVASSHQPRKRIAIHIHGQRRYRPPGRIGQSCSLLCQSIDLLPGPHRTAIEPVPRFGTIQPPNPSVGVDHAVEHYRRRQTGHRCGPLQPPSSAMTKCENPNAWHRESSFFDPPRIGARRPIPRRDQGHRHRHDSVRPHSYPNSRKCPPGSPTARWAFVYSSCSVDS